MPSPYQGVILAAGHGSRMGALAEHYPKALLPVCNVPLIHRHLDDLQRLGVVDVLIVIGHLGGHIKEAVGDGAAWGLSVTYYEQTERAGLAHAVGQLEPYINRPFYLFLGDIYFEFDHIESLRDAYEQRSAGAAIAVREEDELAAVQRNFSVESDGNGRVTRVVEKPVQPNTRCKGCGLYLFGPAIFEAIRNTPRSALRNEYELTDAIQTLVDGGQRVQAVPMVTWDTNITEPDDLIACSVRELVRGNRSCCVGEGCQIHPGAELIQTVIGDGVRIVHPIRLERCVVLPGAVVDSASDLTGLVVWGLR